MYENITFFCGSGYVADVCESPGGLQARRFMTKVSYKKCKGSGQSCVKHFVAHETLHGARKRSSHLLSCFCGSLYWLCKFGDAYGR